MPVQWFENDVLVEVAKAKRSGLRKCGGMVSRTAKSMCPVGVEEKFAAKTGGNAGKQWTGRVPGTLKRSIRYRVLKKGTICQVIAGSKSSKSLSAYYAMWVEFGTRKMAARPFMRPALHQNEPKIEAMFKDTMK